MPLDRPTAAFGWAGYVCGLGVVALSTAVADLMFPHFDLANLIMVYLLGVVVVASRWGRGPSLVAAIASVAAFDFLFVPPYVTFAVSNKQHLVTFAVMGLVALVISTLTVRIREQAALARQRDQHRHTRRSLEERVLVPDAVLTEHLAVFGHVVHVTLVTGRQPIV